MGVCCGPDRWGPCARQPDLGRDLTPSDPNHRGIACGNRHFPFLPWLLGRFEQKLGAHLRLHLDLPSCPCFPFIFYLYFSSHVLWHLGCTPKSLLGEVTLTPSFRLLSPHPRMTWNSALGKDASRARDAHALRLGSNPCSWSHSSVKAAPPPSLAPRLLSTGGRKDTPELSPLFGENVLQMASQASVPRNSV